MVFGYYPTTGFILFSFGGPTSLPMRLHVYLLHDNPEGNKKKEKKKKLDAFALAVKENI